MKDAGSLAHETLEKDLRQVIAETEDLLNATVGQAGEKIQAVRTRVEETLASAKAKLGDFEHLTFDGAKAAAIATDKYVHDNPWPSIGVAAAIGLIAGWVFRRK